MNLYKCKEFRLINILMCYRANQRLLNNRRSPVDLKKAADDQLIICRLLVFHQRIILLIIPWILSNSSTAVIYFSLRVWQ